MTIKFEFTRAKNGIIVKVTDDYEETTLVSEDRFEDEEDVEAFAHLLRLIENEYGPTTSRYSPKRIYIRVEPGDKFPTESGEA